MFRIRIVCTILVLVAWIILGESVTGCDAVDETVESKGDGRGRRIKDELMGYWQKGHRCRAAFKYVESGWRRRSCRTAFERRIPLQRWRRGRHDEGRNAARYAHF